MQYFTPDLIEKICSLEAFTDKECQKKTDQLWQTICKQYFSYFNQNVSACLSKKFLKIYNSNHMFHDFLITDIAFDNQKNVLNIEMIHNSVQYVLTHTGIHAFNINLAGRSTSKECDLMWMHDEFEQLEDGKIKHNILYYVTSADEFSEIEIIFRKLLIKRSRKAME